jgi:hypothetical protein
LITERTAATTSCGFAINQSVFATNGIWHFSPDVFLPSFSISLKNKKKKHAEGKEPTRTVPHEFKRFCHQLRTLPSFWATSYRMLQAVTDGN